MNMDAKCKHTYNVCVVDDEEEVAVSLKALLEEYGSQAGVLFNVTSYKNGPSFLFSYPTNTDLVFMDVNMPVMSGFQTAEELRKVDQNVVLMFLTNLSQYAYKGYEVGALDYILKPLALPSLSLKLKRALAACDARKETGVILKTADGEIRCYHRELVYIEIAEHSIIFHTTHGDYKAYGTLKSIEEGLPDFFVRCSSCYLVNLYCVTKILKDEAFLGDVVLPIARSKKKDFVRAFYNLVMKGRY